MKIFSTLILLAALNLTALAEPARDFVVHEWGTFTSVQGGDGKLLPWRAQQIGDLPGFVYNWFEPGLGRQAPMQLVLGKGGLTSLQRMETPVIYFYSDRGLTANVEVHFPKGLITEWFPQAAQIGSCRPLTNTPAGLARHSATESLIRWENVRVLPMAHNAELVRLLPTDTNGTHYFAARETESALLRANNFAVTNAADEHEKFLFYRGSGSFTTPLVVTTADDGAVSLQNTGAKPIAHPFLLHVENGVVEWAQLAELRPGPTQAWRRLNSVPESNRAPLAEFQKTIGDAMAEALTAEGLFPAEARAMVKTWSNSWFAEEGVRVLYILPRGWTDETLPMKLSPPPRELVRVMVGRAEIITPDLQKEIAGLLKLNATGDKAANERLQTYWKKLGRFSGPAAQLANNQIEREKNKPIATAARN